MYFNCDLSASTIVRKDALLSFSANEEWEAALHSVLITQRKNSTRLRRTMAADNLEVEGLLTSKGLDEAQRCEGPRWSWGAARGWGPAACTRKRGAFGRHTPPSTEMWLLLETLA